MSDIFISIGNFTIKWYSVLMLLALLIGISMIMKEANKLKINENFTTNLIFWTIIFAVIGARLYYVLFNLNYYKLHPNEIIKIWEGGIAIHGAIIFGSLFIIIYTLKYKVNTLKMFDVFAPALFLGQAIGRWGNFFNQEAHGTQTTLEFLQNLKLPNFIIDGMNISGIYYHPTFLYESIWNLIGFVILIIVRKRKYLKIGTLTSLYLMWYSAGRFMIESLRTDSLMLGEFKVAQIVSIILFLIGLIIFIFTHRGSKLDDLYKEVPKKQDIKF
ncbi:MAG: prolipoprotein diacylglyceryl transferase [Bacilli bacterium]|nr:prolipoprotein diacylglyceryl transferase [Bacilli bacterium]